VSTTTPKGNRSRRWVVGAAAVLTALTATITTLATRSTAEPSSARQDGRAATTPAATSPAVTTPAATSPSTRTSTGKPSTTKPPTIRPKPIDPATRNPDGFAEFRRSATTLHISGTTWDPDDRRGALVRVYDNSHLVAATRADARTHQYGASAHLGEGTHSIKVVTMNVGPGTRNRVDGHTTVRVAPSWISTYQGNQGIAARMLADHGWGADEMPPLVRLWTRESNWTTSAYNPSGAYGIPQALPGNKMASAGDDWQTSATTQIEWGLQYISDVYGSPSAAWAHEMDQGWY
jgi:hypothetical protein